MTKKWIGRVLIVVVVLGLLAAGGFAVYRVGYMHGFSAASTDGTKAFFAEGFASMPHGEYFDNDNHGERMMSGSRYASGYMMDRFDSRYSSMGHGDFFSPLSALFHLAFWGVLIWLVYKLVKGFKYGAGWQLSFTRQQPAVVAETEEKAE